MSEFFKLQLLAVVQGLTEFLPVSSSGHLALFGSWLGIKEPGNGGNGPLLELLLHAGTLLAVLFFYRARLAKLLTGLIKRDKAEWRYASAVVISCVPAGLFYALAGDWVDSTFAQPAVIALLLLVTGAILLSLKWAPAAPAGKVTPFKAVIIGIAQAVAILPGISRSGSTYTAGRWLKISSSDAFDFSFIMSIPVIAGAILLKLKDFGELTGDGAGFGLAVATAVAALFGYLALKLLSFIRIAGKFWYFGIYCLAMGCLALAVALCG